jgi:ribose 5-phosphate isomerase B
VLEHLKNAGHDVVVVAYPDRWPEVGKEVGQTVVAGGADYGVVCCWTGTGVSIAANKVSGVRAALCVDAETARGARRWNDANVLALSLRLTSEPVAAEIVDAFLSEPPDPAEADAIAAIS